MTTLRIEKVSTFNTDELQKISRDTFYETFVTSTSEENMRLYLENNFSKEQLTKEIEHNDSEFYFALLENEVIGYLKINFSEAQTELNDDNALEVERVYVRNNFHGKGVGQQLLDYAIQLAKQKNMQAVWLGVWENNQRAINFYKKNGFVTFDKHVFMLGEEAQTDYMMRLDLIAKE
jgi:ribosomal protein S18 acetylase RimI-like enzyme